MKTKLLKHLREIGRDKITVYSITKEQQFDEPLITGMSYGYTGSQYSGLFSIGDTEDDVRDKAMRIFLENDIRRIRDKYKKYSRKYKQQNEKL